MIRIRFPDPPKSCLMLRSNSLLGRNKFPVPRRRELSREGLILLLSWRFPSARRAPNRCKFPVNSLLTGNSERETSSLLTVSSSGERCYGAGGEDGNFVAYINRWSAAMPQPNDLSRSLVALDQDSTIIAVVELSQSSWLVGGILPGIDLARPISHPKSSRAAETSPNGLCAGRRVG